MGVQVPPGAPQNQSVASNPPFLHTCWSRFYAGFHNLSLKPPSPLTQISTCITYEEVSGKKPTLEDLRQFLKGFRREQVVYAACFVSAFLETWDGKINQKAHADLVRDAFFPEAAEKLLKVCDRDQRFVFHRQQILLVAKEAIINSSDQGIDPFATKHWGGRGIAFLMANSLMDTAQAPQDGRSDEVLNVIATTLANDENSGRYVIGNSVARANLMLTKFLPASIGNESLNVFAEYTTLTGLDPRTFFALCLGIVSHYLVSNYDRLKNQQMGLIAPPAFWNPANIEQQSIAAFMREMVADLDQIKSGFSAQNRGIFDMTGFRNSPLIRHSNGGTYAIDARFLIEKLETGIFWRVHNALRNDKRELLHRMWGMAFENYVNWMIADSVDQILNTFVPSPRFTNNNDEVCDGVVLCGSSAIFLEYKGHTFRADAKYSGDPALLQQEIATHLIGDSTRPKGVYQLANSIKKAFDPLHPMEIEGLDLSRVDKVFPLLITRDGFGGSFFISHYLNQSFKRLIYARNYRPLKITPLYSTSVQSMELVSGYLHSVSMSSILDQWYEKDPSLYFSLQFYMNDILEPLGDKRNVKLWETFMSLTNEAAKMLFPQFQVRDPSTELNK